MEELFNFDFDATDECSWKLWDGLIEQEPCYLDGILELDVSDLGLCNVSSSDDASLGTPPLIDGPPELTSDCCEQQLQTALLETGADEGADENDTEAAICGAPPAASTAKAQSKATSRNAARERSRVRSLRSAFQALQSSLPSVPPDTKLSKLDILVLASNYIAHLGALLSDDEQQSSDDSSSTDDSPGSGLESASSRSYLHPVKKWPMRSRLYAGAKPYADDRPRRHAINYAQMKKPSRNGWERLATNRV